MQQKHLFLTGHPNIGKTTLIINTIQRLQNTFSTTITNNNSISSITADNDNNPNPKDGKGSNNVHPNIHLDIHGFYTQECRDSKGQRIGFDIIYYWDNTNNHKDKKDEKEKKKSVPLSRIVEKVKKSDPHVGKYVVNIDNISNYAIPSLLPTSISSPSKTKSKKEYKQHFEIIIMDEIGKMEMLCPDFLPSIHNHLFNKDNKDNNTKQQLIIGTIPTPRYGRIIPAIEEIRGRDDVVVIHVTKDNRDELNQVIFQYVCNVIMMELKEMEEEGMKHQNNADEDDYDNLKLLRPFLYNRPIGSSSLIKRDGKGTKQLKNENNATTIDTCTTSTETITSRLNKPCGPLFLNSVQPKVLVLGETASAAQTSNPKLEYCERSMWTIFSSIFSIEYIPMTAPEGNNFYQYMKLKEVVLNKGICIWDVLSNVHEKKPKLGRNKRQKMNNMQSIKANDINKFLIEHSTIEAILFIGKKPQTTYLKLNKLKLESKRSVKLIVLPSSSAANSRMTKEEKASEWKESLSAFIKDL
jgi:hypoxanthine-DNA glycosylase